MPRFEIDNDAWRLGEALDALRQARVWSQAKDDARAGMISQGGALYAGRRALA